MTIHDPDAEMYAIGAALRSDDDRYLLLKSLSPKDFTVEVARIACEAIQQLTNTGTSVSVKNLLEELKMSHKDMLLVIASFLEKAHMMSAGIDAQHYISRIATSSKKRRVLDITHRYYSHFQNDNINVQEYLDSMQMELSEIVCGNIDRERQFSEMLACFDEHLSYYEWIKRQCELKRKGLLKPNGFYSGFERLDKIIGCFENGTYSIIGARTSSGKTTFIINLIMNMLEQYPEDNITFFTLEMTIPSLVHKLMGAYCNVTPKKLKQGDLTEEEISRIKYMSGKLQGSHLLFNNQAGATDQSIYNIIRRHIHNHKTKIMFVDYITKIKTHSRYTSRHLEIDAISTTLHNISLEFNIPVIALAQLSRNSERRTNPVPMLSDLRESGSLEEHADNVILLHRPAKYDSNKRDVTEVYVAKNRADNDLAKLTYSFHHGKLVEEPTLEEIRAAQMEETNKRYEPSNYSYGTRY